MIRGMTLVTTALVALAPFTESATPARPTRATTGTGTSDGRTTDECRFITQTVGTAYRRASR